MSTSLRAIPSILPSDPRSDRLDGLAVEPRAGGGFEMPIDVKTAARFPRSQCLACLCVC